MQQPSHINKWTLKNIDNNINKFSSANLYKVYQCSVILFLTALYCTLSGYPDRQYRSIFYQIQTFFYPFSRFADRLSAVSPFLYIAYRFLSTSDHTSHIFPPFLDCSTWCFTVTVHIRQQQADGAFCGFPFTVTQNLILTLPLSATVQS